jgi:K+:H+ antiporter
VTEHQLFLALAEVVVLVAAARLGGELAARMGAPQVVGELVFGLLIGPSLLGKLWPAGFDALFPNDPVQRGFLDLVGWMGVIFLVLAAGLETKLGILRRAGRAVVTGWVGGFFLPFAMGFGLGWLVPAALVGTRVSRPIFAMFLATAMSISAIPVIARILLDLNLLRTEIGMVIVSTALADDTVGWIILAVVAGLATSHTVDLAAVATAIGGTAAFLLFAFTLGQWLIRRAILASAKLRIPHAQTSVLLLLVVAGGAITQAIHVHLVLGTFIVAVVIRRSRGKDRAAVQAIRQVGMGFFVPFFFGYMGIKVDLTTIRGDAIGVAVAAVAVACVSKLVGGGVGARIGGLPTWSAAAVGAGLNARGAMELVIAAIGLSLGILTLPMFSIIVLIAVLTSLMAAPLLKFCVRRADRKVQGGDADRPSDPALAEG